MKNVYCVQPQNLYDEKARSYDQRNIDSERMDRWLMYWEVIQQNFDRFEYMICR